MKLHEKIRWARKQGGWSVGYMRKRTGIAALRISEIEAGKPVKMSELVAIADALKRDVTFFLCDDDPKAELFLWCLEKQNRAIGFGD